MSAATQDLEADLDLSTMPRVAPALLLPAHLSAQDALPRLLASEAAFLAVRRVEGLTVYWYSFDMAWARERVQQSPPQASLKRALDLQEFLSAPARASDAKALMQPLERDAVVLDDGRFIGVQTVASVPLPLPDLNAMRQASQARLDELTREVVAQRHRMDEIALRDQRSERRVHAQREVFSVRHAREQPEASGAEPPGLGFEAWPEAAAPAAPVHEAPPFTAHPRFDAPELVQPRQVFTVTVGLAEQAQAGVIGGPITIDLPASVQAFELGVQLIVDGFEPAAGQGLQAQLQVNRDRPADSIVQFELVAPGLASDEPTRLSSLRVLYLFEGQVCGMALRRIAVVAGQPQAPERVQGHGQLWTQAEPQASAVCVQPGLPPVDLTVVIDQPDGDPSQGRFVWRFTSPHTTDLPHQPVPSDLGTGSQEFGGKVITEVHQATLLDMAELMVTGLGRTIYDAAPPELWQALRTVHRAMQAAGERRALNVLLLTAEPHVPWELALFDDADKLIADAPPLLGCQVNLGRWPLDHSELPPRAHIEVQHMAAVVGDYAARSGWRKLQQAMEEGAQLVQRYQAVQLAADAPQIKKLLTARLGEVEPGHGAEAVHFACHGEALQQHALDAAVILADGMRLSPLVFANAPLGKRSSPFLFMNACQVGKASELLASFSGFAGESIKGGFRGFLAPLWSVEDQLARDIALGFYEQVFGDGTRAPRPVAEVLREMRARFADTEPNSLTRLAYVFYGHPGLTLSRSPSSNVNTSSTLEPQP
ncbi:TCAD7 domain-containing protein [Aquabacterium parvum]|uniref:TCAD7 domain-containing protein n=1 Tax=Aquabacterium parvum TaxID=70584 RepID=UPI000718AE10|nr:TCAD7 domain-containing protein [Aquabacterium parvum]